MSVTFGLTPQGFVSKPTDQIDSEVDTDIQGILGASAGTEPDGTIPADSFGGQLKALIVDSFNAFWELLQGVVASWDPDQNGGASQDAVAAITATVRDGQTFSTVTAQCTGDPGTIIPGPSTPNGAALAQVPVALSQFAGAGGTLAAVTPWAPGTPTLAGQRVTNAGNVYQCIGPGITAGSGGPTTQSESITDNTVTWAWLGVGTAVADIVFTATSPGPVGALSYQLSSIQTPVQGWRGITNVLDASVGSLIETDSALRARREQELAPGGESVPDAIRSRVLAVGQGTNNPVTSCRVFYNDTDYVDINGLLPHSVEIVVAGGPDDTTPAGQSTDPKASVASAVWSCVAAGTRMLGSTAISVIDSQGVPQTVAYQRPAPVPVYIIVHVSYDPTQWPTTGAAALVEQAALSAILTYATGWLPGVSVRSQPIGSAVNLGPSETDANGDAVVPAAPGSKPAPGIVEVTEVFIGTAPNPGSAATISITPFQIAQWSLANIQVVATTENP